MAAAPANGRAVTAGRSSTGQCIQAVAFVVVGDETYGVQRFVGSFIQALVEQGIRPAVVALQDGPMFQACVAAGAQGRICPVDAAPDFGRVSDALKVARHTMRSVAKLATVLKEIAADAVFVRTSYLVALVALAGRKSGSATFWLLPNLVSDRYPLSINKLTYDLLMRACGMVPIANSNYTRTSLLNLLSNARVAHLGINPDEFDPAVVQPADRQALGLTATDAVIGVFARLIPYKGQKLLIEALAARRDAYPDLKLLICGGPTEGPYYQDMQRTIAGHGLHGRVIFTGPIVDVRPYYGLCDVVANVRLDPEPFGLSIIEAMLMAKPVLVHALGGPSETVVHLATGWHIGAPTLEAFVAGLDLAFRDRSRWSALGASARHHALTHFTHRDAARRILAIVSECAGGRR